MRAQRPLAAALESVCLEGEGRKGGSAHVFIRVENTRHAQWQQGKLPRCAPQEGMRGGGVWPGLAACQGLPSLPVSVRYDQGLAP